ncbi:MAG: hypothetical protein JWQ42_1306 [Edaphobacter sp.]|nr:hypothetical protein [Edaphobacter sp.]
MGVSLGLGDWNPAPSHLVGDASSGHYQNLGQWFTIWGGNCSGQQALWIETDKDRASQLIELEVQGL